jgi:hypothetical protein
MLLKAILFTKPDPESSAGFMLDCITEDVLAMVLRLLDYRGIAVSPAARTYITKYADYSLAITWLEQAFTVTSTAEMSELQDK